MKLHLSFSLFLPLLLLAAPSFAGDLLVEIKGIRSSDGRIFAAVHQRVPDVNFPDPGGAVCAFNVLAREGSIQVVFKELPPGDYAVTAYHDENNSGEIDRNALGIPTEGYGFGNDAMGFMAPPKFEDTAVTLAEGEESVTAWATLKY